MLQFNCFFYFNSNFADHELEYFCLDKLSHNKLTFAQKYIRVTSSYIYIYDILFRLRFWVRHHFRSFDSHEGRSTCAAIPSTKRSYRLHTSRIYQRGTKGTLERTSGRFIEFIVFVYLPDDDNITTLFF